jgi:hypothetical protein
MNSFLKEEKKKKENISKVPDWHIDRLGRIGRFSRGKSRQVQARVNFFTKLKTQQPLAFSLIST